MSRWTELFARREAEAEAARVKAPSWGKLVVDVLGEDGQVAESGVIVKKSSDAQGLAFVGEDGRRFRPARFGAKTLRATVVPDAPA